MICSISCGCIQLYHLIVARYNDFLFGKLVAIYIGFADGIDTHTMTPRRQALQDILTLWGDNLCLRNDTGYGVVKLVKIGIVAFQCYGDGTVRLTGGRGNDYVEIELCLTGVLAPPSHRKRGEKHQQA